MKKIEKQKAINLRLKGKSYSEIKKNLGVNKSTLSGWLKDYPLPEDKMRELRDNNPKRIENFRNTMANKRRNRLEKVFLKVKKDISKINSRDLFIGGLFLYWGEGSKRDRGGISFTNTNPAMIKFFIKWLELMGYGRNLLKVNLHLYADMDSEKQINFWSKELHISKEKFRKPYIKEKKLSEIKYKNGFGQGTCSVILEKQEVNDYILSALRYFEETVKGY